MSQEIVTLKKRKERAVTARKMAVRRVSSALACYARQHGGKYLLFGSAARGELRFDSDIDIIVDFPIEHEHDAICMAEDACAAEKLPCDVLTLRTCDHHFLSRIRDDARVLT